MIPDGNSQEDNRPRLSFIGSQPSENCASQNAAQVHRKGPDCRVSFLDNEMPEKSVIPNEILSISSNENQSVQSRRSMATMGNVMVRLMQGDQHTRDKIIENVKDLTIDLPFSLTYEKALLISSGMLVLKLGTRIQSEHQQRKRSKKD